MSTRLATVTLDSIDKTSKAQIIRDLNEWFMLIEGLPVTLTRKAHNMSIESLKKAWRFAWYVINWEYQDRPHTTAREERWYDVREVYRALECGYYELTNPFEPLYPNNP